MFSQISSLVTTRSGRYDPTLSIPTFVGPLFVAIRFMRILGWSQQARRLKAYAGYPSDGCQGLLTPIGRPVTLTSLPELPELTTAEAAGSADPAVGLRAVRALQRLQERLEAIHVANAREQGWSWQAIAEALGVSRQAVHQKYNRRR